MRLQFFLCTLDRTRGRQYTIPWLLFYDQLRYFVLSNFILLPNMSLDQKNKENSDRNTFLMYRVWWPWVISAYQHKNVFRSVSERAYHDTLSDCDFWDLDTRPSLALYGTKKWPPRSGILEGINVKFQVLRSGSELIYTQYSLSS